VRRQDADGATGAAFVWEENDIRRHASYLEFPLNDSAGAGRQELLLAKTPTTPGKQEGSSWRPWRLGEKPVFSDLFASGVFQGVSPGTAAKVLVTIALPLLSFYAAREIAFHRLHTSEADRVRPQTQPVRLPSPRIEPPAPGRKPDPFPTLSVAPAEFVRPAELVARAEPAVSHPPVTLRPTLASDSLDRLENDLESSSSVEHPIPRPDGAPVRATPMLPEPPPIQPAGPAVSFLRIVASPPATAALAQDRVIAYLTPESPSPIKGAFQKVFTGHGTGDGFVPASPVESPLPSPPANAVPSEQAATNIKMLAKVDRLGNVVNVKVVEGNRQLAGLSADALLRWRFDPARRNGTPVESAMRIRFEFLSPFK